MVAELNYFGTGLVGLFYSNTSPEQWQVIVDMALANKTLKQQLRHGLLHISGRYEALLDEIRQSTENWLELFPSLLAILPDATIAALEAFCINLLNKRSNTATYHTVRDYIAQLSMRRPIEGKVMKERLIERFSSKSGLVSVLRYY